jgi:hypothetical protein
MPKGELICEGCGKYESQCRCVPGDAGYNPKKFAPKMADLDELLQYWKDYRTTAFLTYGITGLLEQLIVTDTIAALEDYRALTKQVVKLLKGSS